MTGFDRNIHSSWGPSSSQRRILCPGSLAAEANHKDTDNIHAVIGSAAHELGDLLLGQSDLYSLDNFTAEDFLGEKIFVQMSNDLDEPIDFGDDQVEIGYGSELTGEGDKQGYLVTVDNDMAHHIDDYVAHIKTYIMDKEFTGLFKSEMRVSLNDWLPDTHGTADSIAIVGNTLHVDDLKYGQGVRVYAEGNTQGRCYALGVVSDLAHLYDFDDVKITIYQPRLGNIDSELISVEALLIWAQEVLVPAYDKSLEPNAPRIPGDKQCTFCKHMPVCAELRAELDYQMAEAFPIMTKDHKTLPSIIPLDVAKLAEKWAKAVEAYAYEQLLEGKEVTDGTDKYKLVTGKSSRKWKDENKARQLMSVNFKENEYMKPASFMSVAQVEKVVGKKTFATSLKPLVNVKKGRPTIAKESDKREDISSADAMGFKDISK